MTPRRLAVRGAVPALAIALLSGCSSQPAAPTSSGAIPAGAVEAGASRRGYAGSASCRECHEGVWDSWDSSLHARTVHEPTDHETQLLARALLCEGLPARYVLGEKHSRRFLVPSESETGTHVLLPCRYDVGPAAWVSLHESDWKNLSWERGCGGCHSTGFSSASLRYKDMSVGCEACHGPSSRHGDFGGPGGMAGFEKARVTAREEVTVCASCHLQGGRSRSSGLSFAADYEPGRDLFTDYEFDWSSLDSVAGEVSNPIDIHQKLLIRDQAGPESRGAYGDLRCTSCHAAHAFEHDGHVSLDRQEYCYLCHARTDFSVKEYDQSCNVCEF